MLNEQQGGEGHTVNEVQQTFVGIGINIGIGIGPSVALLSSVPMLCVLYVWTVPTLCILNVGTVPALCIFNAGTVPTFSPFELVLRQWPPQPRRQRAQQRRGPKIVNFSRTEGYHSPSKLVLPQWPP